jgi:eukaryotic-like serine/threonine-protein kinase
MTVKGAEQRWEQVKDLLHHAMQLAPEERSQFLTEACSSDDALRSEVESLLLADADVRSNFLHSPSSVDNLKVGSPAGSGSASGLAVGEVFAQRFQLVRPLGEGGMGQVWLAEQTSPVRRQVALKVIKAGTYDDSLVKRFQSEQQSLAIMDHPAIAKVFDAGATPEGQPYFVMEYVPGLAITEYCDQKKLKIRDRIELFIEACEGVQHAHQKAVIHRDLKPANILVVEVNGKPAPRIIDFGLAKAITPPVTGEGLITQMGHLVGTPAFMSPEQASPATQEIDPRTDVYSLGVILYVLLTGLRPFETIRPQKQSLEELLRSLREEEPPRASSKVGTDQPALAAIAEARGTEPKRLVKLLRGDLDCIASRALEPDRARRYATPSALAADLRHYLNQEPATAHPAGAGYRVRKYVRRHRAAVGVTAGLIVLLGLAAGEGWRTWREHSRSSPPAATANHIARKSVAIVGFKNLSGKPEQAWLSTALAEMLTTELAAGEQLRVIPGENVVRMKRDLALPEADSFGNETLAHIRNDLGSDLLVSGSYLEAGGQLRLDVHMQDAHTGDTVASFSENGAAAELLELVSRAGSEAREKLAIDGITTADRTEVRAALPSNPDAARLYAGGLDKVRQFEFLAARGLLEKAVTADPSNALAHSALATVWSALGYDQKAGQESRLAFELSSNIPRESRLLVEARYREITHDWDKAREIYRTLWNFFPDNLEYGLRLASVLSSANQGKEALATLDELRKMPPPDGADPRIDLARAHAAETLSDFHQQEQFAKQAFEQARARGANQLMAYALTSKAWALDRLGSFAPALAALEQGTDLFARAGDPRGSAYALQMRGNVLYDQGDFAGARASFDRALKVFQEIGAKNNEAGSLNSLGNILYDTGQLDEARRNYDQSLAIYREVGSRIGIASASGNLANVLDSLGDLKGARQKQAEALQAFRDVGDRRGEASTLNNLGNVLAELGDLRGAEQRYEQSMELEKKIGYRRGRGFSLDGLADVLREQDKLEEARGIAEEGVALRRELREENTLAVSQAQMAEIALDQRHYPAAEDLARAAVEAFERIKSPQQEAGGLDLIALAQIHTGKANDATANAEHALKLALEGTDRLPRYMSAIVAARVQAANGQIPQALHALQPVLAEATKNGYCAVAFEARLALGEIEMHRSPDRARIQLRALARDSRERGFERIARLAQAAL